MHSVIRSRDNAFAKRLILLAHSARERKKCGETVLDGAHLVTAFLDRTANATALVVRESALHSADWAGIASRATSAKTYVLADALMDEASLLESPAAIMAVVETPVGTPVAPDAGAVLVLDNVQDPGNVGSLIRSAAAFGLTDVVLCKGSAFAWSPKVLRAGQGAHFAVNIVEGVDVADFLQHYRGGKLALVAAGEGATALGGHDLRPGCALLVGNEGTGLSAAAIAGATALVHIPMPGRVESLNAAACGAVAMYELACQRSSGGKVR